MFESAAILINDRLVSNWTETPIDFDNVDYNPSSGVPFVRLQIEWTSNDVISIGGRERGEGYIDLSLFIPANTGTQHVAGMADRLKLIFDKWDTGALKFKVGRKIRVGQKEEWYQEKVLVPFTFDECN